MRVTVTQQDIDAANEWLLSRRRGEPYEGSYSANCPISQAFWRAGIEAHTGVLYTALWIEGREVIYNLPSEASQFVKAWDARNVDGSTDPDPISFDIKPSHDFE
ncbi:hypothetical protein HOT81_gp007 [Gordonia phage Fryberger]|uniref:Uncharacterized protein n=1 Tax=Gordonia phage Fryberger TaxID=2250392 RepID=A0A346FCG2_9CAUD|nr:hypothetical protein HOT81_gp007 [Gordonia phage Fryberger]AXN53426.1 hypothetical protein SEA_FRYBERGER_7 [Gordonia phage Fryberger]